jgi:XTP/dITP diphosphohydrolase
VRILLASGNPGKLRELRLLLEPGGREVLSPRDVGWDERPVEDGATLEENALKKARAAFAATGVPAVADDTGLFVDALDGAPGVHSARYAGEAEDPAANCAKLLSALAGIPAQDRGAQFRTVLALVDETGEYLFRGTCRGDITLNPRGGFGFGYDPLFELRELGKTFAELEAEAKNRVSHRGRALVALRRHLETRPGNEGT